MLEDKIFQFFFSKTYQFKQYTDFVNFPESEKTKFLIRLYFYVNNFIKLLIFIYLKSNIRVGKKSKEKDKSALNFDNSMYQIELTNPNFQMNNTQTPTNINFQLNNSISPLNINNTIKLDNNYKDNFGKENNTIMITNKNKNFFDIKPSDDEFLEKIK